MLHIRHGKEVFVMTSNTSIISENGGKSILMAREKETFRLELEQVLAAFPNKRVLTRKDVMAYTGRGRKWLDSHGFNALEFTAVDVARQMSMIRESGVRR